MSDNRSNESGNPDPVDAKKDIMPTPGAGKEGDHGDNIEIDDEGDWIAKTTLDDNQKKYLKRVLTQNKNRKDELTETKAKLLAKEQAEQEAQRKHDEENGNWKKIAEERENALKAKDEKLKRAEVRSLAIKEGIIDPKIIDHLPLTGVEYDGAGDLVGADKFVKELKKEMAYLFGESGKKSPEGTTNDKPAPSPNPNPKTKNALEMNDEEYAVAKAEWLKS